MPFPPASDKQPSSFDDLFKGLAVANRTNAYKSLYFTSMYLVRQSEYRLGRTSDKKPQWWAHLIKIPFWLMLRGLEQIAVSTGLGKLMAGLIPFVLLVGAFSQYLPVEFRGFIDAIIACALFGTVLILMFAAPSTFCSAGVKDKYIAVITQQLYDLNEDITKRVELLIKNVRIFEDRAKERLTMFKWILATTWAALSPFGVELIKAVTSVPPRAVSIGQLLPSLALLALAYVLVEAYARGVDIVFRSVEFGCNQHIAALEARKHAKESA